MADVVYNGILRNIYKINVINDTNYSTEPDRTYRENNNASSEVISITPFIAKQGYMNSGFALSSGGTALTSDELDSMLNPWMFDSDITLYALYEEDPSVVRAKINIDTSKLDTSLTNGITEIFTASDFDTLIEELKNAVGKGNNILTSWMQDGVEVASLDDIVWDGTSTTVIEPVFTIKQNPAPTPTRGISGGSSSGGGSSSSSGTSNPERSFDAQSIKPSTTNYSIAVTTTPIFSNTVTDMTKGFTNLSNTAPVTGQYEWVVTNGRDWSLVDKITNKPFANGWVYIDFNGDHGWYRFDEKGLMVTGWHEENGHTYVLAPVGNPWNIPYGKLLIGSYMIGDKLHTFDNAGRLVSTK
jgi:hypothetical protein